MAMAIVDLVCKECGNHFQHRKECYKRSDADSYEEWAKQNITLCPECLRAAARQKQEDQAAKLEQENELPALEGSEKQVAWAVSIRAKAFAASLCADYSREEISAAMEELKTDTDATAKERHEIETAWRILTETSAKWFIDNRYHL